MFMMHSVKAGLLVLLFLLMACEKEKEIISLQREVDSLRVVRTRLKYEVDSLKLYVLFSESQNKQVQQERKTVYYSQPVRSDPALRSWMDEYLRTRADSIQF